MTVALRHRGPDSDGFFADPGAAADIYLGHRRLSIFDPTPAGAQPMSDHSGRYTIVFNGAIYNFIEIAAELARLPEHRAPRSHTDTEVLVEAWAAFGPACLPRLNGMFAFALWDAATRTLYLARDRFGVKPLHYVFLGERGAAGGEELAARLLFASEAKALFAGGAGRTLAPRIDARVLAEFLLTHNIDHHPETSAFAGVLQVPPGGLLIVRPGGLPVLQRYWRITPSAAAQQRGPDDPALTEEARELLWSALALRLRSDVPLGGTLSGGLDSSLLTAAVAGPLGVRGRGLIQPPYRVFMSQFPGTSGDESPWAERVLDHVNRDAAGTVLGLRSSPDPAALRRDLSDVLYHQEEPFADTSIFAHYALMRRVREAGVKVLLTGQGADEIFAGYPSYFNVLLGSLLRSGEPLLARSLARQRVALVGGDSRRLLAAAVYHAAPGAWRERLHRHRVAGEYPSSAAARALWHSSAPRYCDAGAMTGAWGTAGDPGFGLFDRYALDSIERWSLPHILRQDDRNTMAFGIESRAPFLDYRLAELSFTTRPEARLWAGQTKRLLRDVARGVLPEDVRLRADKVGFWSPQQGFLRAEEDWVRGVVEELPAEVAELTDAGGWRAVLTRFYRHGDGRVASALWGGLVASLWIRETLPRFAEG